MTAPPIAFIDLDAQRRRLGARLEDAVLTAIRGGRYILGAEVDRLEGRLKDFCGVAHAIGCANGTDAIVLALMALGIRRGDAVLCPAFTFAASAEAIVLAGATPVFVDVDARSFNLHPDAVERGLAAAEAAGLRPMALLAVDLFGQPCDYDALGRQCDEAGVALVADAAQSFGASWNGRRVGSLARITTTSFFPAKPLGCYGDGGAVLTDDADLAATIRSLRVHGQGADKYDNVRIGLNSRLDTVQAAVLLAKLDIFEDELAARDTIAQDYDARLSNVVTTPRVDSRARSAWAQYTIVLPERVARDAVRFALAERGVPTMVYYPRPLHRQTAYAHFPVATDGLPVSERLAEKVLSLPMHPYLDEHARERVADALREAAPEMSRGGYQAEL